MCNDGYTSDFEHGIAWEMVRICMHSWWVAEEDYEKVFELWRLWLRKNLRYGWCCLRSSARARCRLCLDGVCMFPNEGQDGNIAPSGIIYLLIVTTMSYQYCGLQTVILMTYLLDSLSKWIDRPFMLVTFGAYLFMGTAWVPSEFDMLWVRRQRLFSIISFDFSKIVFAVFIYVFEYYVFIRLF